MPSAGRGPEASLRSRHHRSRTRSALARSSSWSAAAEHGGGRAVAEALLAEAEGFGVDGVDGEGVLGRCFGDGGAAAGGEGDGVGVVAGDVREQQVELLGLPEALGGGGEEVVGQIVAGVRGEHGLPGLRLGLLVRQSGPTASGTLLAGGARVAPQFGGDGRFVGGAEHGEAGQDAPAQFGAAGNGPVGEPAGDRAGVGGDVDEVPYSDQAQAGVVAASAVDEVAAQGGERVQRGGPLVGREVAVGDVSRCEGEDALDDGRVGLVRKVGQGGLQVGGSGQFAVAQGVPYDRAGERVGQAGEALVDSVEGSGIETDLGVGQVAVVEQQQGRALADGLRAGLRDVDVKAFPQSEAALVVTEIPVVQAHGDAVRAVADVADSEGVGAVVAGRDGWGEGVDAGGAQPAVGPGMDVALGGGGEGVDEVGKGGVCVLVVGEVGVDAGQEVLLAQPGHQLTQR